MCVKELFFKGHSLGLFSERTANLVRHPDDNPLALFRGNLCERRTNRKKRRGAAMLLSVCFSRVLPCFFIHKAVTFKAGDTKDAEGRHEATTKTGRFRQDLIDCLHEQIIVPTSTRDKKYLITCVCLEKKLTHLRKLD